MFTEVCIFHFKMFRVLTLLCIFATISSGFYKPDLRVRFEYSSEGIGTTAFIALPKSITAAATSGWVPKSRPDGPEELTSLELWCPKDNNEVCLLFDNTGYVAGLQMAFDKELVSNAVYDWFVQGFTNWTTTLNGATKNYFTTQQYYVSSETLAVDPATRKAARNSSLLLQDGRLWVSGINGILFEISTDASDITGPDSIFTKQQCVPGMGYHYYYNMTTSSECFDETMFPWFPLIVDDQLIGIGFNVFTQYLKDSGWNWFEYSDEAAIRYTVPNAPECLYEVAGRVGQLTLHTYFIENPYEIGCMA